MVNKRNLFLVAALLLLASYSFAEVLCAVKPSCALTETAVFSISSLTNAHASIATSGAGSYSLKVCCPAAVGTGIIKGNMCDATSAVVLNLSTPTNAHAEQANQGNYANDVCITGITAPACRYTTTACNADEAGVASLSSATNAQVEEYGTGNYPINVCCGFGPVTAACTSTVGQSCQPGSACGPGYSAGIGTCTSGVCCLQTNTTATVSLSAIDLVAAEPNDSATIRVTRTGPTTSALSVSYTVSGTAAAGADYQTLLGSIIIQAGSDSNNIVISPIDDATVEPLPPETIKITLAPSAAYNTGNPNELTALLLDNDSTPGQSAVGIVATDATAVESGEKAILTIFRTPPWTSALDVAYTISGDADNGVDYQLLSGNAHMLANSPSIDVSVIPKEDTDVESDENVTLTLAAGAGYTLGTPLSAFATIKDNDSLSTCGNGIVEGLEQCEQTSQCTTAGNVCSFCDCLQTGDNGNILSIEITSDAEEYPIPGTINLKVRLTRKSTSVTTAAFSVSESKIGINGEKSVGAGSVDFVSGGSNTATIDVEVQTSGHEAGIYTYTSRITNPPATETYKTDNIDSVSVTLQKTTATAPELPILFVALIAIFALAIIRGTGKNSQ